VIFCTPGRVDIEPPSVADSLRECTAASFRAYQAAADAVVDDIEDEVVEIFSSGCPRSLAQRCRLSIASLEIMSRAWWSAMLSDLGIPPT
jgi:hypothetical protein